jgi:hypothetical protein
VEVLVEGEQAIRLGFAKNATEFLLNAVDGMEKIPAIDA